MTQTGITDFGCGFGHVVATGAQQLGRALLDRPRPSRRDNRLVFIAKNHTPDLRLEIGFVLDELLLQMFSRKLERHELVMIVRAARGWKGVVPDRVIA